MNEEDNREFRQQSRSQFSTGLYYQHQNRLIGSTQDRDHYEYDEYNSQPFSLQFVSNNNQNQQIQNAQQHFQFSQSNDDHFESSHQSSPQRGHFSPSLGAISAGQNEQKPEFALPAQWDLSTLLQHQINFGNSSSRDDNQKQKIVNEAKYTAVQKFVQDSDLINHLQKSISRKFVLYRKKGMSAEEAANKIITKLMHKKQQALLQQQNPYDLETYSKLKKIAGFNQEESQKTIQLKSEIDNLVDSKGMTSSEESLSSYDIGTWDLSPNTKDKLRIEGKYKKKLSKVMETFIDRVDQHSSSGSCSSDEKFKHSKKRKYQDYLNGLKVNNSQSSYKVPLHQSKKRHIDKQHQVNYKKRTHKDFIRQMQYNNDINSELQGSEELYEHMRVKRLKNDDEAQH